MITIRNPKSWAIKWFLQFSKYLGLGSPVQGCDHCSVLEPDHNLYYKTWELCLRMWSHLISWDLRALSSDVTTYTMRFESPVQGCDTSYNETWEPCPGMWPHFIPWDLRTVSRDVTLHIMRLESPVQGCDTSYHEAWEHCLVMWLHLIPHHLIALSRVVTTTHTMRLESPVQGRDHT